MKLGYWELKIRALKGTVARLKRDKKQIQLECDGKDIALTRVKQILRGVNQILEQETR